MLETIRQLFAHDAWANTRILNATTHQKALNLLTHLLVSEQIWLLRIRGEDTSGINKSPELNATDCVKLADENRKSIAELLASLSEERLSSKVIYKNFKGHEFQTPLGEILLHVALHGTYHRGQIARVMRENGETPVDTDFITFVRQQDRSILDR